MLEPTYIGIEIKVKRYALVDIFHIADKIRKARFKYTSKTIGDERVFTVQTPFEFNAVECGELFILLTRAKSNKVFCKFIPSAKSVSILLQPINQIVLTMYNVDSDQVNEHMERIKHTFHVTGDNLSLIMNTKLTVLGNAASITMEVNPFYEQSSTHTAKRFMNLYKRYLSGIKYNIYITDSTLFESGEAQ